MLNSVSRFILPILLSTVFSTLSYSDRQISSSGLFYSNSYNVSSSNEGDETDFFPRSEQRFQQSPITPLPTISEVPLLSVKLLNYVATPNSRTQICQGQTHELLVNRYFPKIYELGSQEYLVEQLCDLGIYNNRYNYFIYRSHSPINESDMRSQPETAYYQDQEGYFLLRNGFNQNGSNQLIELRLFDGELMPLTFEQYQPNELAYPVSVTSYIVGANYFYDPSQRILSVFARGRRRADCGSFARYQLEEKQFKLLEYRYQKCCLTQQECSDLNYRFFPEDYPQLYP